LQGEEEWLLFLPVCDTLSDLKPKAQKGIKSQTRAKVNVWEESSASDNALTQFILDFRAFSKRESRISYGDSGLDKEMVKRVKGGTSQDSSVSGLTQAQSSHKIY
jgi:hypothetical protein